MSRPLRIAVIVSLLLHGLIVAAFLLFNRHPPAVAQAPDKPALVELVLREQKGAGETRVTPPPSAASPAANPTDAATRTETAGDRRHRAADTAGAAGSADTAGPARTFGATSAAPGCTADQHRRHRQPVERNGRRPKRHPRESGSDGA